MKKLKAHYVGKTSNAQARGIPPRDCPRCGKLGFVFDTRSRATDTGSYIWRRRRCKRSHKWTTIESLVLDHGTGTDTITSSLKQMRHEVISGLIKQLRREIRSTRRTTSG